MRELKRFADMISGFSWLLLSIFFILYPLILQVGWSQMLIVFLIDAASFTLFSTWNERSLYKSKRYARLYFKSLDEAGFEALDTSKKVEFVEELTAFPTYWAKRAFWVGFVKTTPLIFYLYWVKTRVPGSSHVLEFLKVSSIFTLSNAYFVAALLIETHTLASRYLKRLHNRYDLKEIFDQVRIPKPTRDLQFHENAAVACIWIFMMILQLLTLRTYRNGFLPLEIVLPVIGLVGLAQSTHIWNLGRKYLVDGLYEIFESLSVFDPKSRQSVNASLALHSSPLLAHFERIFNSLADRLRSYERELSLWIFRKAEEGRYSALGEISGMVLHDLSAPLHVVHFCTEQLKEEPEKVFDPRYMEQLATSGDRALDLINALKSYLRAPAPDAEVTAVFVEAQSYVTKMLGTQFHSRGFARTRISVDPALDLMSLRISRPDLIHVLLNIQANSLENMISSNVMAPSIDIQLEESPDPDVVEIVIEDQGTGLTPERFEALTSFAFQGHEGTEQRKEGSLGLRLVRRLIERYGGTLAVDPVDLEKHGTRFRMKLKKAAKGDAAVIPLMEVQHNGK